VIEIRENYNIDPDKSISKVESIKLADFMQTNLDSMKDADQKKVLIVNFAASHTGKVNKNFVYYDSEKAKASAGSWTAPYPKPVIKHHMDGPGMFSGGDPSGYDAIGRIMEAEWVPNSKQEPDRGNGWIRMKAAITDPDAIQKFLDKRYLTVSIGYRTSDVTCNICNKNSKDSGEMCSHVRGQEYTVGEGEEEKKLVCVWTIGEYEGKELSVVNMPADTQAKVDNMEFAEADLLQSIGIKISDAVNTEDGKFDFEHIDSEVTSVFQIDTDTEEEENWEEYSEEERKQIAEELDRIYDELSEILEAEAADAKLSAEQRKKLKSSVFCGPNRSFPVPDCCLTGDTEIKLLNGTTAKIEDLVGKSDFWIYGFDLNQKSIVPAKVSKVWLAVKDQPIYRITLDNGKHVDCTGNHPFLLRDMTYVRADQLKVGDSLMPLYTKKENMHGSTTGVYEHVYQPYYGFWERTHRMVSRETNKITITPDQIAHHKNENKADNRPENIEILTKSEHFEMHNENRKNSHKVSDRKREISSRFMKKRMASVLSDPVKSTEHSDSISKGRRTFDWSNPNNIIPGTPYTLMDFATALSAGVTLEFLAEIAKVNPTTIKRWIEKANIKIDPTAKQLNIMSEYFEYLFEISPDTIYDEFCNGSSYSELSRKYNIDRYTIRQWFDRLSLETDPVKAKIYAHGEDIDDLKAQIDAGETSRAEIQRTYGITEHMAKKLFNHKIVAIDMIGNADAYDMEVPLTSNFALNAGIFVHNSHVTAARRLIGRAKVSDSTKAKILACVSRKAKSLGCNSKEYECNVPDNMAEMIAKITELNEQIASMQKEFNEAEANRIIELAAKNEAIEKLRKELEESEKNVNIFHEWGSALSDDISRIRKTAKTSEHEAIKKIASLVAGISMLPQRFESSEKAEAELKARSEELATGSYAVLMEKFEEQLANVINMTISDVAPGGVTKTITDSLQKDNTSPFTESFAKQPASVQSLRRKYRLTT